MSLYYTTRVHVVVFFCTFFYVLYYFWKNAFFNVLYSYFSRSLHPCKPVVYMNHDIACRLDTWEAEQECWLETIKLLRHHFEIIDSSHNTNVIASNTPTKKRKMEINNRNISTGTNRCAWIFWASLDIYFKFYDLKPCK